MITSIAQTEEQIVHFCRDVGERLTSRDAEAQLVSTKMSPDPMANHL
jgi:hypothetical protein